MRFKRFLRIFTAAGILGLMATAILPFTPVTAATSLTITPSVAPGGYVYVQGAGFTATHVVNIYFQYGGATTTSDASGFINTNFNVPTTTPSGTYIVTATDGVTAPVSASLVVTSALTLSATTGFVGDTVTISGTGFTPSQTVTLLWDSTSTLVTFTATPLGAIPANTVFVVPDSIKGNHTISTTSMSGASQTFVVDSKLVITPSEGGAGTTVSVLGTGFSAGPLSAVTIMVDGVTITSTTPTVIYTNSTGRFTCVFSMPMGARGSHTVRAVDSTASANVNFTIVPTITLSPVTAAVGDTVTISGSGFAASHNVTVEIELVPGSNVYSPLTTSPTNPSTNTNGGFTTNMTFVVPGMAGGVHKVKVVDTTDNSTAITNLTVTPRISITPTTGNTGTEITVTGSGFIPNANVNISWDNATTPVISTTASATGTISVTFSAPVGVRGNHVVKASDAAANSAVASFVVTPKIVVSPTTGGYNDNVTITATGFNANATLTSDIGGVAITTPSAIVTDATGSATITFKLLPFRFGDWTVRVTDAGGSATATIKVTSKLTLSAATGAAGDSIIVTGTGFGAKQGVTIKYNGAAIATSPASLVTSDDGGFACYITIPQSVAGTFVISATDGTNTANVNFTAVAGATVGTVTSPSSPGSVGMDMTVSGTGFTPNATITVVFESTPVTVASVSSDANGSFSATFKIPAAAAGNHTIKASDGTTTKTFAFFMDSAAPGAANLLAPAANIKPKQPINFTWSPVVDPSGVTYTIQISQDAAFTAPIQHDGLTTAAYKMTAAEKLKSAKTPYYWRVMATDQAGNAGAWSAVSTFNVGFMWPSWMIHVWYGLGIVAALVLGLWFGRRMAYQSY